MFCFGNFHFLNKHAETKEKFRQTDWALFGWEFSHKHRKRPTRIQAFRWPNRFVPIKAIEIHLISSIFLVSISDLSFPPTLTNVERCFVHQCAQKLGLKSKSSGLKEDRFITITKIDSDFVTSFDQNKFCNLTLNPDSVKLVNDYLEANPLDEEELAAIEDFALTRPQKTKSEWHS